MVRPPHIDALTQQHPAPHGQLAMPVEQLSDWSTASDSLAAIRTSFERISLERT